MEKEGFIYIWFDKKRRMYYIGCHWGTYDDGYICSSKWMRDAYRYRKQDFRRRIIQRNIPKDLLLEVEYRWLQLINDKDIGIKYYNLSKKHFGHWHIDNQSRKSVRQKLSEASKKLHQDPVYKEKFIEGRKKLPPRSEEAIRKTALKNTGKKRTEETKRKIGDAHRGKICGPLSGDHRRKISESLKGEKNPFYGKQHDPELKRRMNEKTSQTMKGRPPNNAEWTKGTLWWNNGVINRRCKDHPGEGWMKGTCKKPKNKEKFI